MSDTEYDFTHFHYEHKSEVFHVLKPLWKYSHDIAEALFRWKYIDNPHTETPLGIVTLYKGRVVGFRGYLADRFAINGSNDNIIILHPGDTCVDPDHRKKGLSVAMGTLAMQYYKSKYPLFMNMTCNNKSLPGYLKMGFQPLHQKVYLKQRSLNPLKLYRYRKAQTENVSLATNSIKFGLFGDILVTDAPNSAQMAAIIKAQGYPEGKLSLYQDQAFFEWRYRNPVRKYIFYYFMSGEIAKGYIVIDITSNNLSGTILDYGEGEEGAIEQILRYIIKSKHFIVLSIISYGVDDKFLKVLSGFGFSINHPLKKLVKKKSAEEPSLPLLIRPVKMSFTEDDFIIEGVDVRKMDNWRLKPICSDAA